MSQIGHFKEVCQYGQVHQQCRCSDPKPVIKIPCTTPEKHMTIQDNPTKTGDVYEAADTFLRRTIPDADWGNSEHLKDTPRRFHKSLVELTTPEEYNFTTFMNSGIDEMVVIRDIPFYSLCAHHVIPFFGYAHVGYIPKSLVAGLSKFARAVRAHAKGLWVQEELNATIASFLERELDPHGVAVVMEAEHLCMTMRGVQVPGSKTTTSSMLGVFADHDRQARSEFLALIRNGGH